MTPATLGSTAPWRPSEAASRVERRLAFASLVVPAAGVAAAVVLGVKGILCPADLWLCGAMYTATMLGLTAGFHRRFTHRAFEAGRAVDVVLGVLGSMAAQGPVSSGWPRTAGTTGTATRRAIPTPRRRAAKERGPPSRGSGTLTSAGCSATSARTGGCTRPTS